jgi:hypothetical protein
MTDDVKVAQVSRIQIWTDGKCVALAQLFE